MKRFKLDLKHLNFTLLKYPLGVFGVYELFSTIPLVPYLILYLASNGAVVPDRSTPVEPLPGGILPWVGMFVFVILWIGFMYWLSKRNEDIHRKVVNVMGAFAVFFMLYSGLNFNQPLLDLPVAFFVGLALVGMVFDKQVFIRSEEIPDSKPKKAKSKG